MGGSTVSDEDDDDVFEIEVDVDVNEESSDLNDEEEEEEEKIVLALPFFTVVKALVSGYFGKEVGEKARVVVIFLVWRIPEAEIRKRMMVVAIFFDSMFGLTLYYYNTNY